MGSAPSSAAPEMPAMSGRCPPAALSSARDANVESTGTAGISPRWRTFLLHQADPTTPKRLVAGGVVVGQERCRPASRIPPTPRAGEPTRDRGTPPAGRRGAGRSEEHTSELQSHHDIVCRLLLEKKKRKRNDSNRLERKPRRSP